MLATILASSFLFSALMPAPQESRPATQPTPEAASKPAEAHDPLRPSGTAELELYRATNPPFQTFCASCHGVTGRGDGPVARFLNPKPRDFSEARFTLVSRVSGLPSEAELEEIVTRGIPASAMPSFAKLPAHARSMAVRAVLAVARKGTEQRVARAAKEAGLGAKAVSEVVAATLEASAAVTLPAVAGHRFDFERGAAVFKKDCAACHGVDGSGETEGVGEGVAEALQSRDLRGGIMKGGADLADLALRTRVGMPASDMPSYARKTLSDSDLLDVSAWLRGVFPKSADPDAVTGADGLRLPRFRALMARAELRARRVPAAPAAPGDMAWDGVDEVPVSLMPLDWSMGRGRGSVGVRALHDGTSLALRLSWKDTRRDMPAAKTFGDAAGVQLCGRAHPPLFGELRFPGRPIPGYGPAWLWSAGGWSTSIVPVAQSASQGRPTGHLSVPQLPLGSCVMIPSPTRAKGKWENGSWSVVFRRPLVCGPKGRAKALGAADLPNATELDLSPGGNVRVAFTIYDGARGSGMACKEVSLWADLRLDG